MRALFYFGTAALTPFLAWPTLKAGWAGDPPSVIFVAICVGSTLLDQIIAGLKALAASMERQEPMQDIQKMRSSEASAGRTLRAKSQTLHGTFRLEGLYVVFADPDGTVSLRDAIGRRYTIEELSHEGELIGFVDYEMRSAH